MSGDSRDFNNIETRAVKFFFPPEKTIERSPFSSDAEVIAAAET
jgi:hypothetical protein